MTLTAATESIIYVVCTTHVILGIHLAYTYFHFFAIPVTPSSRQCALTSKSLQCE